MRNFCFVLCTIFLCLSCSQKKTESLFTHFAYQAEENGKWGLISTSGDVLYDPIFINTPSIVVNNCFYVQNPDGFYTYYRADKGQPVEIASNLKYVSVFSEGLAAVTSPGEHISYIDIKGNTVFKLETIKNKKIYSANKFANGRALVTTFDGECMYINTKGELAFDKQFFNATSFKDGYAVGSLKSDQKEWAVFDTEGNIVFTKQYSEYVPIIGMSDGTFLVENCKKGTIAFIDVQGNISNTSIKADKGWGFHNQKFVFCKDGTFGFMGKTGVIIPALYEDMDYNGFFITAQTDGKWFLLDENGNRISQNYELIQSFNNSINDEDAVIVYNDGIARIANNKGEVNEKCIEMTMYSINENNEVITDFMDIKEFVSYCKISEGSILNINIGSTFEDAMHTVNSSIEPSDFFNKISHGFNASFSFLGIESHLIFYADDVGVIDLTNDPDDCFWNDNSHIWNLSLEIPIIDNLFGKEDALENEFNNKIANIKNNTTNFKYSIHKEQRNIDNRYVNVLCVEISKE